MNRKVRNIYMLATHAHFQKMANLRGFCHTVQELSGNEDFENDFLALITTMFCQVYWARRTHYKL